MHASCTDELCSYLIWVSVHKIITALHLNRNQMESEIDFFTKSEKNMSDLFYNELSDCQVFTFAYYIMQWYTEWKEFIKKGNCFRPAICRTFHVMYLDEPAHSATSHLDPYLPNISCQDILLANTLWKKLKLLWSNHMQKIW